MPSSDLLLPSATETLTTVSGKRRTQRWWTRSNRARAVKLQRSDYALRGISYVFITFFSLFCLLPFVLVPKVFTLDAYEYIFAAPQQILESYIVTITMTVTGTAVGLLIISMTGYALFRQDFRFRNQITFFIYFTTLFSAGLAPTFLWVSRTLGLRGSYLAVW